MIRRLTNDPGAPPRRPDRPGSIVTWVVIFIIPMLMAVACAVDIGYIISTRSELQNLAATAAVSGTIQLRDLDALTGSPNQATERTNASKPLAGQAVTDQHSGPYPTPLVDTITGYLDNPSVASSSLNTAVTSSTNSTAPPLRYTPAAAVAVNTGYLAHNSVQVTVRLDGNNALPLLFGEITGHPSSNLQATATATAEENIIGFQVFPNSRRRRAISSGVTFNANSLVLPIAMNVNDYGRMFYAGADGSRYKRTNDISGPRIGFPIGQESYPNRVASGADGIREATLDITSAFPAGPSYSAASLTSVHFIGIQIGAAVPTQSSYTSQLTLGPSSSDLGTTFRLSGGGMTLTVPSFNMATIGNFIFNNTARIELLGQPRIIPLYDPLTSGPNHASGAYTIVGFGGMVMVQTRPLNQISSPPRFAIQPEFVEDSTAVGASIAVGRTSALVSRPVVLSR